MAAPSYRPRPTVKAPEELQEVAPVAVAARAPLTYSLAVWVVAS